MAQSGKPHDETARLREMRDEGIDYSDIPETDDSWFKTAELVLELTSDRPKEKISMFVDQ